MIRNAEDQQVEPKDLPRLQLLDETARARSVDLEADRSQRDPHLLHAGRPERGKQESDFARIFYAPGVQEALYRRSYFMRNDVRVRRGCGKHGRPRVLALCLD